MILVTGGAGYIGSHTVKYLIQNGYECVVLDNLSYGHHEAVLGKHFEQIDLLDAAALEQLFEKYSIEAVVHFAAFTYVGESVTDPKKFYRNNVVGSMNLLDAMMKASVKNIVFSSTCAIYGVPESLQLDESHSQKPISPYGRSKLMIENIMEDYKTAYGLNYIALRYFNAAGASPEGKLGEKHLPETHLIPLVLQAIKGERGSISVFGQDYDTKDGTCIRDYIHVDDLASAHELALARLLQRPKSGSTGYGDYFNLGTGVGNSVKEIISAAEKVTGKKCPTEWEGRRAGDPPVLVASNGKAKTKLGWIPRYMDIEEIIATAWEWEKNKW